MGETYPFIFHTSPSPKTIKTIHETLKIRRDTVAKYTGSSNEFMNGYIEAYDAIIEDLEELEKDLYYKKERN